MLLLQIDSFELFLGLHDLRVSTLLKAVKASHEHDHREKYAQSHHKAKENLIVQIVCCECRLDGHLVGHVSELGLGQAITDLLEPACIVKDDENIVVYFVFTEEEIVT